MKRLLLLLLTLPVAASAQNLEFEGSVLPVADLARSPRQSSLIDCAAGDVIQQETADAAFGVGDTGSPNPAGTAREIGQSFISPCAGRVDSLFIVYQPRVTGTGTGEAGTTVEGLITFYDGEGTAGTLLSTTPFSYLVGPDGSAYREFFDVTNFVVTESGVYTFFIDYTVGNSFIQGTVVDSYEDGSQIVSTTGSAAGATVRADRDLRFTLVLAPNGTASEGGPVGARVSLGASMPNPVRTTSDLSFSLETAEPARVAVYDVLGREVAVLADRAFAAGNHDVRFDASALAPGVYVVRLTTGQATVSRTVSVVR